MITNGTELQEFINELNGGATVDPTLSAVLVSNGKAILEEERPWMVLRKVDTSKSVTTGNTWQTAISLATITDFSNLYVNEDGIAVKLFDGDQRVEYYSLKTFDQRLEYKNVSHTCVFNENTKTLYLNGSVPFNGTLYIPYLSTSTEIDVESDDPAWTAFPNRFLPILAYYAVGIYKGAVDYDSINKLMLPENRATLQGLKAAMEKWDDTKQLASLQSNDPSEYPGGYQRAGSVDRYGYGGYN